MTRPARIRRGLALRGYLAASYGLAFAAKPILKRRLARGKEDPDRWREKLGQNLAPRPVGRLIWLHAVGLGEVMSLRGLIARMTAIDPALSFLVTSTTRSSAKVFGQQMPPRTLHQFLPLDAPAFRRRFLDHFRPDACVWVEQDLWPGFVSDLAARAIPQCIVAARMNSAALTRHLKAAALYGDLYGAMSFITAQDTATCANLAALGAKASVTGSLKPAAPALAVDDVQLLAFQDATQGRFIWAVSPAHPDDADIAQRAHHAVLEHRPDALLIIVPRFPDIFSTTDPLPRMSAGQLPRPHDPVWLCDTFGDLGLVYRSSKAVLIGGTFSDIEGHNPWEALTLGNAILHGPRTANFLADFNLLDTAEAGTPVTDADQIALALTEARITHARSNAATCTQTASAATDTLAKRLLTLVEQP